MDENEKEELGFDELFADFDPASVATQAPVEEAPTPAPAAGNPLIAANVREGAGFIERFATGAGGAAQSLIGGAAKGVDNTLDTVSQLGGLVGDTAVGLLPEGAENAVRRTLSPAASALRKFGIVDAQGGTNLVEFEAGVNAIPGFDSSPNTAAEGVLEGGAQFIAGWITAGRLFKAAGAPLAGNGAARLGAQGFVADFISIDDESDRLLSNLIQSGPLANPVTEYLAIEEDDSALERRFKAGLEGVGLGLMVDGVFKAVKLAKSRRVAKEGSTPEIRAEAEAQIEPRQQEFDEAVEKIKTDDAAEQGELFARDAELGPTPRAADETASAPRVEEPTTTPVEAPARVTDEAAEAVIGDFTARLGRLKEGEALDDVLGDFNPARDLNLEKFDTPATLRVLAKSVTEATGDVSRKIPIAETQRQADQIAKDIGGSGDEITANIARLAESQADLPALLTFFRQAHVSSLDNLTTVAAKADASDDEIITALSQVTSIQQALKGVTSNAGRTLRVLRETVAVSDGLAQRLADIDDPRILNTLDPTGKSTNAGDALTQLKRRAKAANGNPRALSRILEPTLFGKGVRVAESYYLASILSGPGTQLVNVLGGLSVNFLQPIERALAGVSLRDAALVREGADQFMQTFMSSKDALRYAVRAWKTNTPILDAGKLSSISRESQGSRISADDLGVSEGVMVPILNGLDHVTQGVHRFILFGDEFNRQIAFQGRVKSTALREGREMGLSGSALTDHMEKRVFEAVDRDGAAFTSQRLRGFEARRNAALAEGDTAGAQAAQESIDQGAGALARGNDDFITTARETVFANGFEHGSAAAKFEKAVRALPGSRILLLPFIRTPLEILKFQIRRTPILGRVLGDVRADISGANGPQAKAFAEARMNVGSALYATGAGLALSGKITGAGPSDPKAKALLPKGWKPFAFRYDTGELDSNGNAVFEYVTYNRGDPIAGPLGLIATALEKHGELDDDHDTDLASLAGIGFSSIVAGLKDKTYLKGISDLIDIIDDPNPDTLAARRARFAGQRLGGFVPSIVANVNDDPYLRASNGVLDGIKARFGGTSQDLDARRDILGRPLPRTSGYPNKLFGIAQVGRTDDPVLNEIAEVAIASESSAGFSFLPKSLSIGQGIPSIRLTELRSEVTGKTMHDRWGEIVSEIRDPRTGQTLHESLDTLINSNEYKELLTNGLSGGFQGTRAEAIGMEITRFRKFAKAQLIQEESELRDLIGIAEGDAALAVAPGTQPRNEIGSDPNFLQLLDTYRN